MLILAQNELASLSLDGFTLFVTALSGIASAAFVVSWLLSVRTGAYMMVEVFLLLGVILPIALCRVFFAEEIVRNEFVIWPIFYTGAFYLAFNALLTWLFNKIEDKLSYFSS